MSVSLEVKVCKKKNLPIDADRKSAKKGPFKKKNKFVIVAIR